jgi:hypothetical protein
MIGHINSTHQGHIVTVEDPVEFVHQHRQCIVTQREVGGDTPRFGKALRSVLRQDPDIILVGELRDLETIEAALTLAETGHLTFGTLHTSDAVQTINRIVDVFPAHQQQQVRTQLSFTLEAVFSQQLLPVATGRGTRAVGGDPAVQRGRASAHPRGQEPPDLLAAPDRRARGHEDHGPVAGRAGALRARAARRSRALGGRSERAAHPDPRRRLSPTSWCASPARSGACWSTAGSSTEEQWSAARERGGSPVATLLAQGQLTEEGLFETLGLAAGIPPVDLTNVRPDPKAIESLPKELCFEHGILPLARNEDILTIAVSDPFDVLLLDDLRRMSRCQLRPVLSHPAAIKTASETVFDSKGAAMDALLESVSSSGGGELDVEVESHEDLETAAVQGADAPAVKLVNMMLLRALKEKASRHPHRAGRQVRAHPLPRRRQPVRGHAPAACAFAGADLAPQDHGVARHRRALHAPGRQVPDPLSRTARSTCASRSCPWWAARRPSCASSTRAR